MPPLEVHFEQAPIASVPPKTKFRWADGMILIALAAIGLALRLAHLTAKPFWFDECFSVELARLQLGSFLRVMWWREANMSLYYALLRGWLHFGQSEFFFRGLSVLFAVATIPIIYWLARGLYDRRVALLAAVLFTFNAYSVRYAQEARGYSLFVLLTTLSSGFFVCWLRDGRSRDRIFYVASSVLAVYAHFYALLLISSQWIVLRIFGAPDARPVEDASRSRPIFPWRAIGASLIPLLIFVAKTGAGPLRWVHRPGWHDVLAFWQQLSGGSNWLLPLIFLLACGAAVVAPGKHLLRWKQPLETWRVQFLLVWLVFPVVLTIVLSFLRPVFLPRFLIFCQPALIILAAAGVERLRKPWLILPALALILLLAMQGIFFVYGHDYDDQRDASGEAANFILDHSRPGDAVIFHIAEVRLAYEFFRSLRAGENTASPKFTGHLGPEILFPQFGSGLDYSDFKAKPIPEILRSELPNYSRVWIMYMYSQAGGAGRTTAVFRSVLAQSFAHTECRDFAKVEVCLYTRD
jgi:mannosyltransferase